MSNEITLYDLPSKPPCKTWSLNPWKTRLVLNYKSLPYTTSWTEYPDLSPVFTSLNVPPNNSPDGSIPPYTSPCIKLPSGECIQDSWLIAQALEKAHPTPSLHLDSPYLPKVLDVLPQALKALQPIYIPRAQRMVLNPRSAAYFKETREKRFGMSLTELENSERGGQAAYQAASAPLGQIVARLQEKKGPFFDGAEVGYVDFVFVGFLRFMERLDVLENVLDACEAGEEGGRKTVEDVYASCAKWLERDDH